jgi:hypothetical protein
MQRQSDPQSLFAVHFTVGHPTVEAQPDLRPPGLTQVQPDPQLPDAQSPAPEQVPSARQRLVPPPISRQTQPDPQGLSREHAPAGQVGVCSMDRTQVPFPHVPPGQSVPFSRLMALHLPCLRFVHGGHAFLALVSARSSSPSVPARSVPSAARRERTVLIVRVSVSNRC